MSPEQMRAALLAKYPGSKRIANMPENQLYATYMRLMNAKKL